MSAGTPRIPLLVLRCKRSEYMSAPPAKPNDWTPFKNRRRAAQTEDYRTGPVWRGWRFEMSQLVVLRNEIRQRRLIVSREPDRIVTCHDDECPGCSATPWNSGTELAMDHQIKGCASSSKAGVHLPSTYLAWEKALLLAKCGQSSILLSWLSLSRI